jgi:hypothetical protein
MAQQLVRREAEALANGDGHRLGRMVEGQFQSGKAQHPAALRAFSSPVIPADSENAAKKAPY